MIPEEIRRCIDALAELPSLGPRQATRLAFYIANQSKAKIAELSQAIAGLSGLQNCERCFRTAKIMNNLCPICADPHRDQSLIAVVEKETDVLSLEKTKKFTGRYLLLGELSKEGILTTSQKLRLNHLKNFIVKTFGKAKEIIIALSHSTYGDLDASLVADELKSIAQKITRLGRGLPTGGEIEFADDETLGSALEYRK